MHQIELWFELASTYSYPAVARAEAVARAAGIALAWRPFLLGPIFKAQGWNDSPFNIYPAKGQYMWRDLARICADLQLPWRRPSQFPRGSLPAARLACWFQDEAWVADFIRRVYRANFAEDRDIGDAGVLRSLLEELGQSAATLAIAESPEAKAKLRDQTARAQTLGIFGAPTFVVGSEIFWGNDRLDNALAWAKQPAR